MKIVIQIAKNAKVSVANKLIGKIDFGYMILVGITDSDTPQIIEKMVNKVVNLRIFKDENDKTNLSIKDVNGSILSISQFTLYADCNKGNRPSFVNAAGKEKALSLYNYFNKLLMDRNIIVETGEFGAEMMVDFTNVGPFTIVLDSEDL